MLRVGIAGIGFMGMIHYLAYQRAAGAKVAALWSRSAKKRAGDWRDIQGNFGPRGEQIDLAGVSTCAEYAELLADESIDLIDICLPPDQHAQAALAALSARKHVFCEKPISVSLADADRMVAAAKSSGKQLLIGHVLPFMGEFAFALAAVRGGQYGKLRGGYFKRIISDPIWLKDFYDPHKTGGPLVDLHIHDAHFIRLLFGMPRAVMSSGRLRGDVVDFASTQFMFDDLDLCVSSASGVIHQQGRPFTHGFEIYFENATLVYNLAGFGPPGKFGTPLSVLTQGGEALQPELPAAHELAGFTSEIEEVARAIASGQPSHLLDGGLARDALELCHKQTESVRRREVVKV